jgi:FkbM family methyltransferase
MPAQKVLDLNAKHDVQYCVSLEIRDTQIRTNIRKVPGRIQQGEFKKDRVAIVGYGPSLAENWQKIRDFSVVFTCSGSHKFLLSKGLNPREFRHWYHVEVDPREHKIELLGEPHRAITYLPASCCHPKYIQHILHSGADIKLWHVFARDGESEQVIPKGEWSITGGSDVGMRAMTIARFLGYTDFHIFGLDGCKGRSGNHAGKHPNQPKGHAETIYLGRKFHTTAALLECAKQVFHELDQMPDVKATFYGDGLIQAMAKNHVRKAAGTPMIAEMKPQLISDELREMNRQLHEENPYYGVGGGKYADLVKQIKAASPDIESVLDYGCGKGFLQKSLDFPIWQYDPAVPEFSEPPRPADLVVCTDVLEHIEPDKLDYVLDDLKRVTLKAGYFVIHLGAARKTYPDGRNAHLIQQPADWWVKKLSSFFNVDKAVKKGQELHLSVGPKTAKADTAQIIGVRGKDGIKARFYVPNDTCRWRAETLASKEPCTIDWIGNMPAGSVLFDVGANVGSYSAWAGVRGVKVFAFEPEAENYALLVRNLDLNNLTDARAYCLSVTDERKLDLLHLSTAGAGGSCHSFGKAVDPFGTERQSSRAQGSVGLSIDELVAMGLPQPDYIKIDVDGFEPQVIKGAHKTLEHVKGLCIEVNPALSSHLTMVDVLTKVFGFEFEQAQVDAATRKAGAFKGVAEYIFVKRTAAEKHVSASIENAQLILEPFPYLYVENVLPEDDYNMLLASLLPDDRYVPIKKARGLRGYPQRLVGPVKPQLPWIPALRQALSTKFGLVGEMTDETLLIRDLPGYSIGPHTDHPQRVLSAILYLAPDDKNPELGTTIYTPKDPKFRCKGGPHYKFSQFKPAGLMLYKRNCMFVFLKTDNSFHGVETTLKPRDVLLYDLQRPKTAI